MRDEVEKVGVVIGRGRVGVEAVKLCLLGAPGGVQLSETSLDGLPVVVVGVGIAGGFEAF
ncbi:hypothetical protein [Actinomadura sp. KC216]|uniref:hypothetical protein n=1 Tax=Actinomadura sp. KC216 TaxID=2530370 RepID=UPI001A9DCFCF|nr:hypothetical protein [Actinomadura sp. KC216]